MAQEEKLSASLEDYLETIYEIEQEKQAARAKDIVMRMNVSNASVTGALRILSERKLVNYAPYDLITMTPEGRVAANKVIKRHQTLKEFFTEMLRVSAEEADEAACKMEHAMSADLLERLSRLVEFAKSSPNCKGNWVKAFQATLNEV